METETTVELTRKENVFRAENFLFCVKLKLGLCAWVVLESLIWSIFFFLALYFEYDFIEEEDLLSFIDNQTEEWYFYLIFGGPCYYIDQKTRTNIIIFNFLLMLIFLSFLIFCLILLWGIKMSKPCGFIPYFAFSAIFIILAAFGFIVGLFVANIHLIRVCFVFLVIKISVEIYVIIFFKKMRLKEKSSENSENASVLIEEVSTTAV